MKKNFSIGEVIGFGWDRAVKNILFFFPFLIITFLISIFLKHIEVLPNYGFWGVTFFLLIAMSGIFLTFLLSATLYRMGLNLTEKKEKLTLDNFETIYPAMFKFILGMIAYGLIVCLGLLLFIVPGIIWAIKYQFVPFLILEDPKINLNTAFHKSNMMASGVQWKLFWFRIISSWINFSGILFFGIGIFFTMPAIIVAKAQLYKKLKKK